jgi:hypothetical protein
VFGCLVCGLADKRGASGQDVLKVLPGWSSMEITERSPYQGLSSQFASRWRRLTQTWPLLMVILGVVLSFGWTAILVWVVWGLIDLTT